MKTTMRLDDERLVVFEQTTEDEVCPTCGNRTPRAASSTMTLYYGDYKHTVPCRAPMTHEEARAQAEVFAAGATTGLPGL